MPRGETNDDAPSFILPGGKVDPDAVRMAIGDAEIDDAADETGENDADGLARVTFTLKRDLDKRLDKYLTDRIPFMSRSQLQRLIDEGGVQVNGREPKASTKLRVGDTVVVAIPPPPPTDIQPEAIPLDVLFEDACMIVVNKQPGLIVHPARSHLKGTLLNALVHHFGEGIRHQASGIGEEGTRDQGSGTGEEEVAKGRTGLSSVGKDLARPGVVHRLDKHTSGVMVVAKDDTAHWRLGRQFEDRRVDKRYLALVEGIVEADVDVIDVPLGPSISRAKGAREKQQVRRDQLGKPAVTIYRVRERFYSPGTVIPALGADRGEAPAERLPPHLRPIEPEGPPAVAAIGPRSRGFTLVELELKTGRTHQIRVHMSHIGHPLVGDDMYGGHHLDPRTLHAESDLPEFARQALHATVLGIHHPMSNEPLVFTAPVAEDLASLIGVLRARWVSARVQTPPGATVDLRSALP